MFIFKYELEIEYYICILKFKYNLFSSIPLIRMADSLNLKGLSSNHMCIYVYEDG